MQRVHAGSFFSLVMQRVLFADFDVNILSCICTSLYLYWAPWPGVDTFQVL